MFHDDSQNIALEKFLQLYISLKNTILEVVLLMQMLPISVFFISHLIKLFISDLTIIIHNNNEIIIYTII